jgi:N-acetylneuraminate lyase
MQKFSGLWPALVTPLSDDMTVNTAQLRDIVGYLLGKGVDGFYVGGTTGEGIYLPVAERKTLAEAVIKQVSGRVPVIVHIGATSALDAVALARHAADQGAQGISSVLPPLYNNLDSLTRYYETIAAAAPNLPVIGYLLNPTIDTVALMRRLAGIPNLGGVKYTGPNMYEMRQIIDLGAGRWTVFSGMDEQCVYAAMMGADGAIGSTLNFMPGVYKQIRQAVTAGDYAAAQELQERANRVIAAAVSVPFSGALKHMMGKLGVPAGVPALPNLPLTDAQRSALDQALGETEFDTLSQM